VDFEVAVLVDLNHLFVLFSLLLYLVDEATSLDSEDVEETLHHVAVELVRHGSCALY